jgi:c-di-GMP-binding flagellar brake protein YcgR
MTDSRQPDLRNSIRFPLHLPVTLKTLGRDYQARTSDISAGGILFHMESDIDVGSLVEFTIEMPADVLGSEQRVLVNCQGRVVRCSEEGAGRSVAVVIDEYHFERI